MAGSEANRYPFILRGLMEGLSGRQILGSLREAGLGMRTQNFYRWKGQAENAIAGREEILGLAPHQRPTPTSIEAWPTTTGKTGYNHVVEYHKRHKVTGEEINATVSVQSDTLLTRAEAEEAVGEYLRQQEKDYPEWTIEGWTQTNVRELVPFELTE